MGVYHCFRCLASGKISRWLAGKLGVPYQEITKPEIKKAKPIEKFQLEKLYPFSLVIQSPILKRCVDYLMIDRGLTEEQIQHFDISFVIDGPWWLIGALAFPLFDSTYPEGYVYRKRKGGYGNPGIDSDALFNARALDSIEKIYVVEGPMDCIKIYPLSGIATLGKDVSEERLDRLSCVENDLVIAMDGDAWVYSQSICRQLQLRGKTNVEWIKLDAGYDPGEIGTNIIEYELQE